MSTNLAIKVNKMGNECYRPHLDIDIEVCAVGKEGNNSNDGEAPTTLKEALEHLDETYKKLKNIEVILGGIHKMIKSSK